jgi:hypothetical protein
LDIQLLPALIVIKAEITQQHQLIVIHVTNRIILQQQIQIMLQQEYQLHVRLAIQLIRDGNQQLLTMVPSR